MFFIFTYKKERDERISPLNTLPENELPKFSFNFLAEFNLPAFTAANNRRCLDSIRFHKVCQLLRHTPGRMIAFHKLSNVLHDWFFNVHVAFDSNCSSRSLYFSWKEGLLCPFSVSRNHLDLQSNLGLRATVQTLKVSVNYYTTNCYIFQLTTWKYDYNFIKF